jgi:hypothetical protein
MLKPGWRGRVGIGVVGCALALAGCDSNPKLDLSNLFSQLVPATPKPAATPAIAPMPTPEQMAAMPSPPQLARFHHMRGAEVEALVGGPDFRRVEPPAELWQYRTADCVVDLFFYGKGDDRRVVHEDARGRDPRHADNERCGDGSQVLRNRMRVSSR